MKEKLSSFQIEKKLIRKLYLDLGKSGVEFFNIKMRFSSIKSFSDIEQEVQMRFIYALCEELYIEIFSKDKLRKYIFEMLLIFYNKHEVYSFMFWMDFFKGMPPINFLQHFFGQEIGNHLCNIYEKKINYNNIRHSNDINQYTFVYSLIIDLTKDNEFIRKKLISNFIKYLMYGESKSFKLKSFINIHNNVNSNQFISNINEFFQKNSNEIENNLKKKSFEVIDTLHDFIKNNDNLENYQIPNSKKIDINEIIFMLGRYIGRPEANKIVHSAMRNLSIRDINLNENYVKKNFVDFIIEKSEIGSYSKQKQKMIKTLLFMLLKM
jgi:hypothetical protein